MFHCKTCSLWKHCKLFKTDEIICFNKLKRSCWVALRMKTMDEKNERPMKSQILLKSDCIVPYKNITPPRIMYTRTKLRPGWTTSELFLTAIWLHIIIGNAVNSGHDVAIKNLYMVWRTLMSPGMIVNLHTYESTVPKINSIRTIAVMWQFE